MASITIELPKDIKDWIERPADEGGAGYESAAAYFLDLAAWDRAERELVFDEESLGAYLDASRASGVSNRTPEEIFADAMERARVRSTRRG